MSNVLAYSETMLTSKYRTDAPSNPRSAFQPGLQVRNTPSISVGKIIENSGKQVQYIELNVLQSCDSLKNDKYTTFNPQQFRQLKSPNQTDLRSLYKNASIVKSTDNATTLIG
jgi:hypothetical protein